MKEDELTPDVSRYEVLGTVLREDTSGYRSEEIVSAVRLHAV